MTNSTPPPSPDTIGVITTLLSAFAAAIAIYQRIRSTNSKTKLDTDEIKRIQDAGTLEERVAKILIWMDGRESDMERRDTLMLLEVSRMLNQRLESIDAYIASERNSRGEL